MKERPILFSAPMVRAILAGTKTQTRRAVSTESRRRDGARLVPELLQQMGVGHACQYGATGDHLWVKETWCTSPCYDYLPPRKLTPDSFDRENAYRADTGTGAQVLKWRPSIFMMRWMSRITLEITGVRVERLQEISEADAKAEGCLGGNGSISGYNFSATPREHYRHVWDSINGKKCPWASNPWVFVIEFKRVEHNQKPQ